MWQCTDEVANLHFYASNRHGDTEAKVTNCSFKAFLGNLLFFLMNANANKTSTWQTRAFIAGLPLLYAGAPVKARWGVAGLIEGLAIFPRVLRRAAAAIRAHLVLTHAAVLAGWRNLGALVDVLPAGLAWEEGRAVADVVGIEGTALTAVGTRIWGTRIGLLAVFTYGPKQEQNIWLLVILIQMSQ